MSGSVPTAILIVEDDPSFGRLLEEVARDLGLEPERCPTAESAWLAFQRCHHPVVLTDWVLPGEDGLALCRRIRASPDAAQTVTVVITGRHQAREIGDVLASGASDYVLKSSDPATLQIRIGLAVRHARALAARAEAEAATARHEVRFDAVATNVPVAILRADVTGACVFANAPWTSLAGRPVADSLGDGWLAAVHAGDREGLRAAWDALARDGTGFRGDARLVAADGRLRWGAWTGVPLRRPDGGSDGHLVAVSDVSDRVAVDRALRAEHERLELAGRGWAIGVWDWDVRTDRLYCSERLVEMLGWGGSHPAPSTASEFAALLHPADRPRLVAWIQAHLERHEPYSVDVRLRGRSGRWRWFNSRGHGVWDAGGEPLRMAGVLRDVTSRRRAERLLRRAHRAELRARREAEERAAELARQAVELAAARNAALETTRLKSEFLATMSHELRTPLNGVIGMTDLLLDTPLSEEQREFATHARTAGVALLDLINDILDLSRIEAGHLDLDDADVDLPALVDEAMIVVAERAETRGLELGAVVDPTIGTMAGDPRRLRQVLVNLLGNATKFTERGGVVVRVLPAAGDDSASRVRIEVVDTGPGIDAESAARLFQPFVQVDGSLARKYGGTGLGLAISRRLVEAMGGSIGVASEPGVGSTFWCELPWRPIACRDADADREANRGDAVCVTPGEITREVLVASLGRLGYRVRSAADATGLEGASLVVVDDTLPDTAAVIAAAQEAGARVVLLATLASRAPLPPGVVRVRKPLRFDALRAALASTPPAPRPTEPTGAATRAIRVLVAEDNATNQTLARVHLKKLGHHADIVANGRAAVEAALRAPYDLILMDCEMPEMDGLEATARIRMHEATTGRRTPIVALTANAMAGDRERCLAAGMDDYVAKPLVPRALAQVITRTVTDQGGPTGGPTGGPDDAVDEIALDRLRAAVGNADGFAELVDTFLGDVQAARLEVRAAIEHASATQLARTAHALKGSSAAMGAHRLASLCASLERAGRTGALDEARRLAATVDTEAGRVVARLNDRDRP